MDDDEIRVFADGRPPVPPYSAEARARARERLLVEARGGRGFRLPRFGWQMAAAFGVTVALVGGVAVTLSSQERPVTGAATADSTVAAAVAGDLDPRPGQFILVESDTMHPSYTMGANGQQSRHLYRTHRKIWQSVDGSADGLLLIEGRPPQPWPGEALPESAKKEGQGQSWHMLASCPDRRGEHRTDYAYLSGLPADPAALRERLYRDASAATPAAAPVATPVATEKDVKPGAVAFRAMTDLVRETYLPKAQRDALFEAAKSIDGVQVTEGVEDASGRKGVALGMVELGTLTQAIFDPETRMFMGERQEVVDAGKAGAPKGSLLALTAQVNVSVVDRLPAAPVKPDADMSCTPAEATDQPATDQPATDQPTDLPVEDQPAEEPPSDEPGPAEDPSLGDQPSDAPAPAEDPSAGDQPTEEPSGTPPPARPVPTPTAGG